MIENNDNCLNFKDENYEKINETHLNNKIIKNSKNKKQNKIDKINSLNNYPTVNEKNTDNLYESNDN